MRPINNLTLRATEYPAALDDGAVAVTVIDALLDPEAGLANWTT